MAGRKPRISPALYLEVAVSSLSKFHYVFMTQKRFFIVHCVRGINWSLWLILSLIQNSDIFFVVSLNKLLDIQSIFYIKIHLRAIL